MKTVGVGKNQIQNQPRIPRILRIKTEKSEESMQIRGVLLSSSADCLC